MVSMRRRPPPVPVPPAAATEAATDPMVDLAGQLVALAAEAGLDAVAVAPADPFVETRRHLEARKAEGLHGGMQFTYRRPERSTDPRAALPGAQAVVVAARSYDRGEPAEPPPHAPHARVARYAWRDHYAPLRAGLSALAAHLEAQGWRARVLADDNALVDREAAYRAGLGWYGKNANLLLPGRGSWFVLGSVVTDAPLPPSPEPQPDGCGSCRRCLPACPTGALVAPGVLDARRCLAHLVQAPGPFPHEYREALGDRLYGCDDCQDACPPNRLSARGRRPPSADDGREEPAPATDSGAADAGDAWVPLLDLLTAPDGELLARFGRWYIPDRDPRYLRRNALVVLGNVGDPDDPATTAALSAALHDADPLLRAHAVWAARRLGRDDLVAAHLAAEDDPGVVAELARPVVPRARGGRPSTVPPR
jgi:epoxyqueuosine reductase